MCFRCCFCCKYLDNSTLGESYTNTDDATNPPITIQPILAGYYRLFATECLDEHNRYRACHDVPMVTLNANLCAYATEWARILADTDTVLVYRSEAIYGENLFVARDYSVDARIVVKSWYDEINSFDFTKPENVHGVDQFTQMIWKNTREIGVGVARKGQNTWVVVNYDPKGNIPGNFEENVPRPIM